MADTDSTLRGIETKARRSMCPHVAFAGCPADGGRVVKLALERRREKAIHATCPHCGNTHPFGMARPLRRGETCDFELPPPDPTAKPSASRRLTYLSDDDFLAAIPTEDTPAQIIARTLDVTGTASGAMVRCRAEWLNFDTGAERIIITRQGIPKPTLLRRVEGKI